MIAPNKPEEHALRARLGERFDLTAAETEVALALAAATPIAQIASARNVSTHTVRTQLKAIYAKTHINRQPELVRMLQDLAKLPKKE